MIIGNKSDLENRQVTFEEGRNLAKSLGFEFLETSAKDGSCVQQAFMQIGAQMKGLLAEKQGGGDNEKYAGLGGIKNKDDETEKKGCAC